MDELLYPPLPEAGLAPDPYRYEDPSAARRYARDASARFDRLALTLRAAELLLPRDVHVLVYRSTRLHVLEGRDLRRGAGARWVMVGVPADASVVSIVHTLGELRGAASAPLLRDLVGAMTPEPAPC